MSLRLSLVLCLLLACCATAENNATCQTPKLANVIREATCVLYHSSDYGYEQDFSGTIKLTQLAGKELNIEAEVTIDSILIDSIKRGFHVHQFGHIMYYNCTLTGPHFNPYNVSHGGRESEIRHLGDFGNIEWEELKDKVLLKFNDTKASLFGDQSILGRSLVIHEFEDDLGSKTTADSKNIGSSGKIVSCCVIALSDEREVIPE